MTHGVWSLGGRWL